MTAAPIFVAIVKLLVLFASVLNISLNSKLGWLAESQSPGVSVARIALDNELNASLLLRLLMAVILTCRNILMVTLLLLKEPLHYVGEDATIALKTCSKLSFTTKLRSIGYRGWVKMAINKDGKQWSKQTEKCLMHIR